MKIVTIIGARPQFIKAAVVSRALQKKQAIEEVIIHTGQHFDKNMSEVFFEEMDIPKPKYNLNINRVSHGAMTGRMLESIEGILLEEKPDYVLVYGDTNSTLAGAIAASKLHIPIAHVEAGLRSFNMMMPEEINRILTDRVSTVLFCPTINAVKNLEDEGYSNFGTKIINSGDVMYDAALYYSAKISEPPQNNNEYPEKFVLATIHREENLADKQSLLSIINAINDIHNNHIPVIFPIHPGTAKIIKEAGIVTDFKTINPVSYLEMIDLIKASELVITDSGGLQKEAFFFGKFCLTIREQTEWVELVEHNVNFLVGADSKKILDAFNGVIKTKFPDQLNLYGTGNASDIIAEELSKLCSI